MPWRRNAFRVTGGMERKDFIGLMLSGAYLFAAEHSIWVRLKNNNGMYS